MVSILMGVSDDLQEECHLAMLYDNMNISHLMFHAQKVEEARVKRKSIDAKRARSFDGGFSEGRLEIQDNPRFKKRVSNQVPFKFYKARDYRLSNPKPKKGRDTSSPTKKPTCGKCGKKHYDDCLKRTNNCFFCGKSGNKVRDFPNVKGKDKERG